MRSRVHSSRVERIGILLPDGRALLGARPKDIFRQIYTNCLTNKYYLCYSYARRNAASALRQEAASLARPATDRSPAGIPIFRGLCLTFRRAALPASGQTGIAWTPLHKILRRPH